MTPGVKGLNVVVVVLDDLGFGDLGCYGSPIATPNIDAIASEGVRYSGFHVTSVCSSTRASLLTARNHHAVGFGSNAHWPTDEPGYSGMIPASAATLPQVLGAAGYATYAIGKWHLTPSWEMTPAGPFDRWPLGLGFDRYYGFLGGMTDQWTPDLVRDNTFVEPPASPEQGYHLTEDLTDEAIRVVVDHRAAASDRPFLLYYALGAVHSPHHVTSDWIDPYRGVFDDGWDAHRVRVFDRQRELGIVPRHATLTARPPWVEEWDALAPEQRRLLARQMEVYAGFMAHADHHIGRLVRSLDELGIADDTLLMVMSDNGASPDGGPNGVFLVPHREPTAVADEQPPDRGGVGDLNMYSWGWAWAGNTPFRLWKFYTWLGGVRVPLIIRHPGAAPPSEHGSVRHQFCHVVDVMPTILEAAGVQVPDVVKGVPQQPVAGRSFLATLADSDAPPSRTIQYFEMVGSRAIYADGWKATTDHVAPWHRGLVQGSTAIEDDRWELFDLDTDFSESRDLADEHPDHLAELVELWQTEAEHNLVLPQIEPPMAPPQPLPGRYQFRTESSPIVALAPMSSGFRLEMTFDADPGANGVLIALHDCISIIRFTLDTGCSVFIDNGSLVVCTRFDDEDSLVVGTVGPGSHDLVVELLTSPGDGPSHVRASLDGADALEATRRIDHSLRPFDSTLVLIGRERAAAVSTRPAGQRPSSGLAVSVAMDPLDCRPGPGVEEFEAHLRRD